VVEAEVMAAVAVVMAVVVGAEVAAAEMVTTMTAISYK
jgi:hypothetical protein